MPVITFSKKDLLNLIGEEIEAEELKYNISMIGTDLEEFSEEITVEIFPDRPDMLSVEGFARALEGFLEIKTGLEKFEVQEDERFVARIEEKVKKVRPAVVCAVVKDVELSDEAVKSLMQIQEKLHITHGRDRRRVSIGFHDLDKIAFPVTYTTKPPEFSFIPLESFHEMSMREILSRHKKGKEYAHLLERFSEYPVWIDSQGKVLSMPPIINS
ncbi:MAG: phenylalanine--tRNA ligase subunit beta, partial [Candidatus Methanofastidiosia archaeon]